MSSLPVPFSFIHLQMSFVFYPTIGGRMGLKNRVYCVRCRVQRSWSKQPTQSFTHNRLGNCSVVVGSGFCLFFMSSSIHQDTMTIQQHHQQQPPFLYVEEPEKKVNRLRLYNRLQSPSWLNIYTIY